MSPPATLLHALVQQAPDAIIYADCQGIIQIWNRAATDLFGHDAQEVLGQSLDMIIPENLRKAHWAGFHHAVSTGQAKYAGRVMTSRSCHKNGHPLYVDLSFSLIRDDSGAVQGVMATGRDVTLEYRQRQLSRKETG